MYLYLGTDTVVNTDNILGIFDLENTTISRITKGYLTIAQREGRIREVSTDLPKSFVLVLEEGKVNVYLTQIAPSTLIKRVTNLRDFTNL